MSSKGNINSIFYMLCPLLPLSVLLFTVLNNYGILLCSNAGVRIKTACTILAYKKIFQLNPATAGRFSTGQILNLFSADTNSFMICVALELLLGTFYGSTLIVGALVVTYFEIGAVCFVGMLVAIIIVPIQMYLGHKNGKVKIKAEEKTDKRITMMNSIIAGIKVIKMCCLEKLFNDRIMKLRRCETKVIFLSNCFKGQNLGIFYGVAKVVIFITILLYVLTSDVALDVSQTIKVMGILDILKLAMIFLIPGGLQFPCEMLASFSRLQEFLFFDKSMNQPMHESFRPEINTPFTANCSINMRNLTAEWSSTETKEISSHFKLSKVNLAVSKGSLVAVVGSVGSGKTSLLKLILGEMNISYGYLSVNGSVAYVPQEPWIFSGTLQENILFGNAYNQEKYQEVIEASALKEDIKILINGDQTLVGERGITLSGGQKARVNLARALYHGGDIFLLDDPLSAVDVKVGKHIFDRCICGFLATNTRILVTHHLQMVHKADWICIIENGMILNSGTYEDVKNDLNQMERGFKNVDAMPAEVISNKRDLIHGTSEGEVKQDNLPGMISFSTEHKRKENQNVGKVSWRTYKDYLLAGQGVVLLPLFVFLLLIMVSGFFLTNWWVMNWVEIKSKAQQETLCNIKNGRLNGSSCNMTNPSYHPSEDNLFYIMVYTGVIFCVVTAGFLQPIAFYKSMSSSSIALHNKMFSKIMYAPLTFFEDNSAGCIMNRFTRDTFALDVELPINMHLSIVEFCVFGGVLVSICIFNPWCISWVVPLFLLLIWTRIIIVSALREFKRIESVCCTPIFEHIALSIEGSCIIRAFGKEEDYIKEFEDLVDKQTAVLFIYFAFLNWSSQRLDCIMSLTMIGCIIAGVLNGIDAGALGISMNYIILMTGFLPIVFRRSGEVEGLMTSLERVKQYGSLDPEKTICPVSLPESWPQSGAIVFDTLTLKYKRRSEPVLKNISLQLADKEKVGIVGRTGAGKSSLVTAILRLVEPQGRVIIDGVDTKYINLIDVRSNISVIPQDPVLFEGSLRMNIDPFMEYTDQDCWNALEAVQLKHKVQHATEGLQMNVGEVGCNLSVGQRQLVCLARAILKHNKILILDEATANVDQRTDGLIQAALRDMFRDCTVLCIAHRISTVLDMDKILVLENGEVVQYDKPVTLLQDHQGLFYQMAHGKGGNTSHINRMAKLCYNHQEADNIEEKQAQI